MLQVVSGKCHDGHKIELGLKSDLCSLNRRVLNKSFFAVSAVYDLVARLNDSGSISYFPCISEHCCSD